MTSHPARRDALRGGVVIASATGVMNAATYGYTLLTAHRIGPAAYGAFAALLGLVIVVNVLSLGLQATAARRVAAAPGDRHIIQSRILATSIRAGLALAAACLVAAPLTSRVLGLESWTTAAMLAVPAFCFAVMGGQAGILQGEGRWIPLAFVFASLGVSRMGLGALGLAIWPTTAGAMLGGVAVAAVVPVLVGAVAVRQRRPDDHGPVNATGRTHSRILREVLLSSHTLLAFFALATVDIVVARVVLDGHQAGLYAAGLILVKAVQFLPQFVVVVAFPAMARRGTGHHLHLWGLGVILAMGAVVTLVVALWPSLILGFVGGHEYAEVQGQLWLFAIVGTLLAAVQLIVYSALARMHHRAVLLIWAALAAIAGSAPLIDSGQQLLVVVATVDVALLAILIAVTRSDVVDLTSAAEDPLTPAASSLPA